MKNLFKSKLAFIVFVILFTSFLALIYKDSVTRTLWAGSIGGLIGFVFAQWYWVEKMKDIKHLLDARMATPEQAKLLESKDKQINEMSNEKIQLIERIIDLQKEFENYKNEHSHDVKPEKNFPNSLVEAYKKMHPEEDSNQFNKKN